jgi:hypothetical protein
MEEYIVKVYNDRTEWFQNEKWHRVNGPAIEYTLGDKFWYVNGDLHRMDGPAFESSKGCKSWYKKNILHRTDGPAIEYKNGEKEWWLDGIRYTEEQFKKIINPVVELTVDEISKRLGFTVKVVGDK